MNQVVEPTNSDIGHSVLGQYDLSCYYKTLPYRLIVNDENFELDSDFLNFVYNLLTACDDYYDYPKISVASAEVESVLNNTRKKLESSDNDEVISLESWEEIMYDLGDQLVDVQGMYWDDIEQRDRFLEIRKMKHNSFTNISNSKDVARDDENIQLQDDLSTWKFKRFFSVPKPKLSHFQLRNNLVCLNNSKDIFYSETHINKPEYHYNLRYPLVKKVNTFTGKIDTVLNLEHDPNDMISTLASKDNLLLAGTINGTYHLKNLTTDEVHRKTLTTNSNGIVNFMKIQENSVLFSCNDGCLTNVDLTTLKIVSETTFPWAINSLSICPFNKNIKLIVGDNKNTFIIDERIHLNEPVNILRGHKDFSFCCDWSPNGKTIVTGNQDATIRLYDVRNLKEEQFCIRGESESSIRTVNFNGKGDSLVFTESIDYINIIDLKSLDIYDSVGSKQVISVFGKLIGSQFTEFDDEGSELLTVGISDDAIGGILQYEHVNFENKHMDYDFL